MKAVFDASALLAALFAEKGMDVVMAHLEEGAISAINLAEVATRLVEKGEGIADARGRIAMYGLLPIPVDVDLAWRAAELRPVSRAFGLSLGDRICLALAMRENVPVLTADRAWRELQIGVEIKLIRNA